MSEVKLEPCPFCGCEGNVQGDDGKFFSHCMGHDCFCSVGERYDPDGMPDHIFTDPESAAEAWNRRAPHPAHAAVEAMAEALEKAEWAEWPDPYCGMQLFCAECRNFKKRGHSKDCAIGTALAAYRATQNKDVRP